MLTLGLTKFLKVWPIVFLYYFEKYYLQGVDGKNVEMG
jgi:hypothetical protein